MRGSLSPGPIPFGCLARQRQAAFRTHLSPAAQQPTDPAGRRHPYLLAHGYEEENLYPDLRGPHGALAFFEERAIRWWSSTKSADRPDLPTRNLASSQVSCVNFLLPLANVPGALATMLQVIDPRVEDVVPIVDWAGHSSPVELEWVGWREPLEGGTITRGAYVTSPDALIVGRTVRGLCAFLIEWKYCEQYLCAEDKGAGQPGIIRRRRYERLFAGPGSSFNDSVPFGDFLHEPFYQLMRMRLLGDRMLQEGVTAEQRIDEVHVVVVCPRDNHEYRLIPPRSAFPRRWPHGSTVEAAMRAALHEPARFSVIAQEDLAAALRASPAAGALGAWSEYHALRYGW